MKVKNWADQCIWAIKAQEPGTYANTTFVPRQETFAINACTRTWRKLTTYTGSLLPPDAHNSRPFPPICEKTLGWTSRWRECETLQMSCGACTNYSMLCFVFLRPCLWRYGALAHCWLSKMDLAVLQKGPIAGIWNSLRTWTANIIKLLSIDNMRFWSVRCHSNEEVPLREVCKNKSCLRVHLEHVWSWL